jgi:hypothetical protein
MARLRLRHDLKTKPHRKMKIHPLHRGATLIVAASFALMAGSAFAYSSTTPDESALDTHNTYLNHDGESVHSPARSRSGEIPDGATARCRDGTWSFSRHHSGTCSRHGSVAAWR